MAEPITVKRTIGLNTKDGLGFIFPVILNCDAGNHMTPFYPIKLEQLPVNNKFSYHNPKTGNYVYRECDD